MALSPRCPRCGEAPIFASLLKVHHACEKCNLAFEKSEAGDGPTGFTILILGLVVMVIAGVVEFKYTPPLWVHTALWVPTILGGSIFCLRFFKTMLIRLDYQLHKHKDNS